MTPPSDTLIVDCGSLAIGCIDDGDGVPLVLVHGAESDRTQFAALRAHLGPGIRAISYDQRDTGVTVSPPTPYTVADLADDVVRLLDGLGIDVAHVLGTSFGGMIAQHLALAHPDRLAGLVLVATTPSGNLRSPAAARLGTLSDDERRAAMTDLLFTPEGRATDPVLRDRGRRVLTTRTPEQQARRMAVLADHDVLHRLGEIRVPTLVVHGSDDALIEPDAARALVAGIPGAQLAWIEGGRHGIATEFPARVAALVRSFLGLPAVAEALDGAEGVQP
jgi:pimeloyl-ACP methyl ester carboxylesterase